MAGCHAPHQETEKHLCVISKVSLLTAIVCVFCALISNDVLLQGSWCGICVISASQSSV